MKIGVDCGHTLSGEGTGAQGCGKREEVLNRELGKLVISKLVKEGNAVIDCTVDKSKNNSQQLKDRVNKANAQILDLFVSIHFNAFNGSASGVEVLINTSGSKAKPHAQRVVDNISKLGFKNRGVKTSDLYVVKYTKAPAMLIETCFIDNSGDMNTYLKRIEDVANAIVGGILNKVITTPSKPVTDAPSGLYAVCVGAYGYENAKAKRDELIKKGYGDTYLIPR